MFHWWYIPLAIILLPLVLILVWICSMRTNMPWQNVAAVTSNLKIKIPEFLRSFALSGKRDYTTLPDPLVMADGSKVVTPEQFTQRREEILKLFETHVYGTLPKDGFSTDFSILEEGSALNGAATRKQVKITVRTDKGASDALMILYCPKQEKPAPAIIGLNFRGNHTVLEDPAILPSFSADTADGKWEEKRGSAAQRWNIADSVAQGYAVATIYSADLAPDGKDTYASRVIGIFDEPEFKAVGAWAFGILRGVDYLMTDENIDQNHIAVVGHSRLGKAALWAGANDQRIGLVISNDSGNSGSSLSRGHHGETVYSINKGFPHWFCSGYRQYGNNENALPLDQNLLLASIAPRKLYVANAHGDLWADPQGSFNALQSAKSAYALFYGSDVLSDNYPDVDTCEYSKALAIHVRTGWHDIQKEDWKFYIAYMNQYFLGDN